MISHNNRKNILYRYAALLVPTYIEYFNFPKRFVETNNTTIVTPQDSYIIDHNKNKKKKRINMNDFNTEEIWYLRELPGNLCALEDPKTAFHVIAAMDGKCAYDYYPTGLKPKEGSVLSKFREKFGERLKENFLDGFGKGDTRVFFSNNNSYVAMYESNEKTFSLNVLSFDRSVVEEIRAFVEENTTEEAETESSPIYVIGSGPNGLHLQHAGDALGKSSAKELVRDNYLEESVNSFDYIKEQFSKEDPDGRIAVFHGPPGTGKTYMVRSLIAALKSKVTTVFVPPESFSQLSSPGFITMLLDEKDTDKPYLLVLEDADSCLVPRAADNMHSISSLLNFSDGIMGGILDIRIVATSNAKIDEFDSAITRPGRCCEILHLDHLDLKKAKSIFHRLVGEDGVEFHTEKSELSLAEIYEMAGKTKAARRTVKAPKREKVGF